MLLGVCEGGDAPLVYGGEIDEEHVHFACPTICLSGGRLYVYVWYFSFQKWGVTCKSLYHCRRVLCIMSTAGGGWRLRES